MSEQQKPDAPAAQEQKLPPAELKKRAKAEKQARRAAQKEQTAAPTGGPPAEAAAANVETKPTKQGGNAGPAQQKPKGEKQQQPTGAQKQGEQNKGPGGAQQASLPVRNRRGSQSQPAPKEPVKRQENKQVELFSHLYNQPRRHTLEGVSKDVHPAVLALGFQMSSYEICGSSARCVAMLLAFKEAIQEYTTPAGTSLARHLTSHYLSPQIDFLKSCRPISESMGNAIRWLKKLIVEVDPDMPEHEAKDDLCDNIDRFIMERITATDQAIASSASQLIKHGSVVLTYAKSSIVEKTILQAHAAGTKFRLIVVDSRPLFEGKNLATSLMNAGLQVEYYAYAGLARAVSDATLVLLGAHSMLSNGRLQSRIGTASLAAAAHRVDIPVIVCCESVKFSGKVALDSIVINEVAPAEELLLPAKPQLSIPTSKDSRSDEGEETKLKNLHDWKDIQNLQILNLMYDITPAEYIRMVICEYGSVPPSSVPVVHRLANEGI
ncbi:putative translation initiation factor eIF-2B subunit delta [Fulvia fulva]|uniref:Translation initiation factor eIF2B subunit delta n=1 Tax=Passalora fulva TaxID=5499 RepID=A0A9Q8P4X6_PASFU|nr:putative translation initiation factor eIF-2B subunit delta [Fulvia fulva]KAK4631614.1 putative translation initiation factor eIF-2B subunit delta [Fulvia fulva]KAK4633476.1 putative translation initiation factor eIF-2B subunit delta [Fulvia fulva]UJO13319.1 putative translation initiation factor eIF-2B subunit delta [Fulvia fulva]WPV11231.1 putative translation initiation factor eIF-2B subunit delta [Fulvia fulva]WPV25546.1 putative translation initiation factor eIF-2B subunit delta [Fulvi